MKALTLHWWWALAVARMGKDIENRSRPFTWLVGEDVVIHAGARKPGWQETFGITGMFEAARRAQWRENYGSMLPRLTRRGAEPVPFDATYPIHSHLLCVATVSDISPSDSPWAVPGQHHHRLTNVRPLTPIPYSPGRVGPFNLPDHIAAEVRRQLEGK